jgi:hypothetical protein
MLTLACWYVKQNKGGETWRGVDRDNVAVEIYFLVIFLLLHLDDTLSKSGHINSEKSWQHYQDDHFSPASSPKSSSHVVRIPTVPSTYSSPNSPRSPKASPKSPSSPPKRMHSSTPQCRTQLQHISSIREKLLMILNALALDNVIGSNEYNERESDGKLYDNNLPVIHRDAFDALRFIVRAGYSKDEEVGAMICSLHIV